MNPARSRHCDRAVDAMRPESQTLLIVAPHELGRISPPERMVGA